MDIKVRTQWRRSGCMLGSVLLFIASHSSAQTIYKCVDAEGRIAYQEQACKSMQTAHEIRLDPPPARSSEKQNDAVLVKTSRAQKAPQTRAQKKEPPVYSFECRTASGALFYRHSACPSRIPAENASYGTGKRSSVASEPVQSRQVPRNDACRGMRKVGRKGREHDHQISTYDRNLGRDPCRRY
jgi:hypothetical protein